jgi:D-serine deaminase-like pyridoxal phosphate-dependent protein
MAAAMKESLASDLAREIYELKTDEMSTPSLLIYPEIVRQNIARTIETLGGDASRWRPHLKTAKLSAVMKMLVGAGVSTAKCATTLELLTACQSGMRDVLVAYPHTGANAKRVAEIGAAFPNVRISVLVDKSTEIGSWIGTPTGLFIDINPGMDRTGVGRQCLEEAAAIAAEIKHAGLEFRGVHFYDGNSTEANLEERTEHAHKRYDELLQLIKGLEARGIAVNEVITSGTPAVPCALSYRGLWEAKFRHQVSPGTVVYNDASSLGQLPAEYGLAPAALVVSRVISHPTARIFTCDAGHKSVSVDSGVPHCLFLGHPEYEAMKPSEEHLPCLVQDGRSLPAIGSVLYLIPRHVCPTVNNFDWAAMVEKGGISATERVTARGREGPLFADPR